LGGKGVYSYSTEVGGGMRFAKSDMKSSADSICKVFKRKLESILHQKTWLCVSTSQKLLVALTNVLINPVAQYPIPIITPAEGTATQVAAAFDPSLESMLLLLLEELVTNIRIRPQWCLLGELQAV
jgi:hypothetical protein